MAIMDVNPKEVDRILDSSNADILLHGHTHRPDRHPHGNKERIVLGDWGTTGWSFSIDDNAIALNEFEL